METTLIRKEDAVALFKELGMKSVSLWDTKRLEQRVNKVDKMVDADILLDNPDVAATLAQCLAALMNGANIAIEDEVATQACTAPKKKTVAKKPTTPKTLRDKAEKAAKAKALKEAADAKVLKEAADAKVLKEAADAKAARLASDKALHTQSKEADDAQRMALSHRHNSETSPADVPPIVKQKAKQTIPGVRLIKTRPYCAGLVIKKHGMEHGITSEMVEELDTMYGSPNPSGSLITLRIAWNAIRGYNENNKDA